MDHRRGRGAGAPELGTKAIEGHLHHRFRQLKIRREWFRPDKRLLDFIADETEDQNENRSDVDTSERGQNVF
jgi:hypothetical protein